MARIGQIPLTMSAAARLEEIHNKKKTLEVASEGVLKAANLGGF